MPVLRVNSQAVTMVINAWQGNTQSFTNINVGLCLNRTGIADSDPIFLGCLKRLRTTDCQPQLLLHVRWRCTERSIIYYNQRERIQLCDN